MNFRNLLEKLERSLKDARRRYRDAGISATIQGAYDPLGEDFEAERVIIVGNFLGTLRDCEALLDKDKKYRVQYATVLDNVKWYVFSSADLNEKSS